MTIHVPRPLNVKAGQYVNVWIPSVSFWSFLQSHPFTIASWTRQEGTTSLDLIIEPRKGLTQKLYACAEYHKERSEKATEDLEERATSAVDLVKHQEGSSTGLESRRLREALSESIELKRTGRVEGHGGSLEEGFENTTPSNFGYESYEGEPQRSDFRLAIFSGPHGKAVSIGDYGKVLMIATGFGIAAQLPYLRELVSGFNNYQVRTREIRLVWQLQSFGKYLCPDEIMH